MRMIPGLSLTLLVLGSTLGSSAAPMAGHGGEEGREEVTPPQDEMPESVDEVIIWSEPTVDEGEGCRSTIQFHVEQKDCWHIYAQKLPEGAISIPTSFMFKQRDGVKLIGGTVEPPVEERVNSGIPERFYPDHDLEFTQEVQVSSAQDLTLTLEVEFMACKDACFPPTTRTFEINLKGCK